MSQSPSGLIFAPAVRVSNHPSPDLAMNLMLSVPERYLIEHGAEEFAGRLKLYAALQMFRSAELSAGAAAELAGIDRFMFAAECARHGIPMIDYTPEELRREVNAFLADRA